MGGRRKICALEKIEADVVNLQNKIRRDPTSYKDDFASQFQLYESLVAIFLECPTGTDERGLVSFHDLINMIAHVADCYADKVKRFPQDLIILLSQHHAVLNIQLRDKIVGCLTLLRNKNLISSQTLQQTFFPILISSRSKSLRTILMQKILSDLITANAKSTDHKLNRSTQSYLYYLITSDRVSSQGLWSIKVTHQLWRKKIWTEAKAVEIMKEAALSDNPKIICGGVRFFIEGDKAYEEESEESSDEDACPDVNKIRHSIHVNKKSRKKVNELKRAISEVKRKSNKQHRSSGNLNFPALQLLHDPQGFAERLFSKHLQQADTRLNLRQKLVVLQLVTRLVGLHELQIPALYTYFLRYLLPRQPSITTFLASLVQATHALVPPESISPLIRKIAYEFVSEGAATEVACIGINTIREVCARQPLAMETTLLQDLVMYRKSKSKAVTVAAKGLLGLYRNHAPEMLKKRDRGRNAAIALKSGELVPRRYGEQEVGVIPGLDKLEEYKRELEEAEVVDEENQTDSDSGSVVSGNELEDSSEHESSLIVHDSEDEGYGCKRRRKDKPNQMLLPKDSRLLTTQILTPEDLEKLREFNFEQNVRQHMKEDIGKNKKVHKSTNMENSSGNIDQERMVKSMTMTSIYKGNQINEYPVRAEIFDTAMKAITGVSKAERLAAMRAERPAKHLSTTAMRKKRKLEAGKSTSNREKARKKNFLMTKSQLRKRSRLLRQQRGT